MMMEMFSANDFREFVDNHIEDEELRTQVSTMTNKQLEDLIEQHIDVDTLSEIAAKIFTQVVKTIQEQEQE